MSVSSLPKEKIFKLVIIGDAFVGKTSLVAQFFNSDQKKARKPLPTIGANLHARKMSIKNNPVSLLLWDTAGEERFRAVAANCYTNAHCLILVFDLSNMASYSDLSKWVKDIKALKAEIAQNNSSSSSNLESNLFTVLVGNKADKDERVVFTDWGKNFALEHGFEFYIETSAQSGQNVETLFKKVATCLLEQQKKTVISQQVVAPSLKQLMNPQVVEEDESIENPYMFCC